MKVFQYDIVVLDREGCTWGDAYRRAGLRVYFALREGGSSHGALRPLSPHVFGELVQLAARGVTREWHASLSWEAFGSSSCGRTAGSKDDTFRGDLAEARRLGFLMCTAVRSGQWVAIEQPSRGCIFQLHCFGVLAQLGCVLTSIAHCNFGSPFGKQVAVLHNKPWLCDLESACTCVGPAGHWAASGDFDSGSAQAFVARCKPSCTQVFGREPAAGDSVSAFAEQLPYGLWSRAASGSLAAYRGCMPRVPWALRVETARKFGFAWGLEMPTLSADEPPYPCRDWFEDPEWIAEACQSLGFRELFRFRFAKPGHINVNESRVFKSWIKSLARKTHSVRVCGILDSRVTIGAAAKGRSSSVAISRVLRGSLGYVLGSAIYYSLLHCYSEDNVADGPSRGRPVPSPQREVPRWLAELVEGRPKAFEAVTLSSRVPKLAARWLRFLLLLGGDIEPNPGPPSSARVPRGPLNLEAGFARSTAHKMQKSFQGFLLWLRDKACCEASQVFASAEHTALALRGYGLHLYEAGMPRYLYVYAITAVQDKFPQHRNFLTAAWQIDKKWQRAEPGSCRPVLPVAAVRAAISVALLWGWFKWAALLILGFLAMLHPAELVSLTRRDLVFPEDTLGHTSSLFVHLRNPKTSRFRPSSTWPY